MQRNARGFLLGTKTFMKAIRLLSITVAALKAGDEKVIQLMNHVWKSFCMSAKYIEYFLLQVMHCNRYVRCSSRSFTHLQTVYSSSAQ